MTIHGTPTTAGTYVFTITATDANSYQGSQTYSITIAAAVALGTVMPNGRLAPYSQTVPTTGGISPYTYAQTSGTLPTGLTLSTSGLVSGTPTTPGSYSFGVQVTDTFGGTATQTYSITIAATVGTPLLMLMGFSAGGGAG